MNKIIEAAAGVATGHRYRVKIMGGPELEGWGLPVGVWDTLASEWVTADDGATWSTTDVSHAQWLSDSLNDAQAEQYARQARSDP